LWRFYGILFSNAVFLCEKIRHFTLMETALEQKAFGHMLYPPADLGESAFQRSPHAITLLSQSASLGRKGSPFLSIR
jgi:hypothetical protein